MNAVPMYDFAGPGAGGQRSGSGGAPRINQRLVDAHAKPCNRTYSAIMHGTSLLAALTSAVGFPLPLLVAFIMWIARKNDCPFVDDHGREQMNFQISFVLMTLICAILAIPTLTLSLFFYLFFVVVSIISIVRAMIAASNGEYFRYPMTIRLIPS